MTTSAKKAFRTLLQYGDGGTPELFTTLAEVTSLEPPEATAKEVEVTSHDSEAAEFILSYVDEGEISGECNFVNDATQTAARAKVGGTASNWQMCFPLWGASTVTFTANASTDRLSATSHQLRTGQPVQFASTGTLPAPLEAGTTYYVIFVDANTIEVAATNAAAVAGTKVDITDTGTGTHTINKSKRLSFSGLVKSDKSNAPLDGQLGVVFGIKITGSANLS